MTPSTHHGLATSLLAGLRTPSSLRLPFLALSLALAVSGAFALSAGDAQAACTPDPPVDDDSVVCDGTDSTGYDGSGATGLTITTDGVTALDDSDAALDSAILVSDGNTVTIGLGATVTVTEDDGFGIRGGNDNDITNDGVIIVDGANGVAIDVGNIVVPPDSDPPVPEADVSVRNNGLITLRGINSVGLNSVDNYSLVNSASGTITIDSSATGGVALQGANDNVVENFGTIFIEADNGRALSIGDNTGLPLPNGAILRSSSRISINGDFGIAVEIGDNVGAITDGMVDLNGDDGIGLSAGNKTDPDAQANFTNDSAGTINVTGSRSYGMKVGDGWFTAADDGMGGTSPPVGDTRNFGTINVAGSDSFGIFAGDETNLTGAHNSFVVNGGTISVMGDDSVGVSLGGNDFLAPLDFEDSSMNVFAFDFDNNNGTIEGGPDAGPLVEFRDFVPGFENRILNPIGSSILADVENRGMPNRGIAILGSEGREFVFNEGTIQGDIRLEGGDDRYVVNAGSTLTGTVFGGDGSDQLVLGFGSGTVETFDLSTIDGFEVIRVDGSDSSSGNAIGWALANGSSFTGETRVIDNGRLSVTSPTVLGGTLVIEPLGSVAITLDPTNTPLTIRQTATLDGTLIVDRPDGFETSGTYRLIQVDGGILGGTTFANEILPTTLGIFRYSTLYDPNGVSLVFARSTFGAVAQGENRQSIGGHFDAIQADMTSARDLQDLIAELETPTSSLNSVYDALTPESYDAQTTLIIDGGRRISKLLLNRPRECDPTELDPWSGANPSQPLDCHARKWSGWLAGVGAFQKKDGFAGHPDYDSYIGGAVFGIDAPSIGDLDLTFAISSQRGEVDVDGAGKSDLVLADLSAHAAWDRGPFRLQGVLSWGWGRHNGRRAVRFQVSETAVDVHGKDEYNSQHVAISGEAGYLIETGPIDIEPIVRLDWTWVDQDSIHEREAGSYGLDVDGRHDSFGSVTSGIRLSTAYHHQKYLHQDLEWMDGIWRPTLDLQWRQNVTGFDRDISARLIGSADSVSSFSIEGKEDKGGLEIGAGLSFVPDNADRFQFDVRYEAYRSSHTLDHNLVAKVMFGF